MPTQDLNRPRFVVYMAMSVDGYIAGPKGELDWLESVQRDGEDYGYADFMKGVDALLIGRNTFDVVSEFPEWPYDGKSCFVVTHRPAHALHGEQFVSGDTQGIVEELRAVGANQVYVDGGQIVRQWLDAGLVDRMTLSIVPVLLGQGIRLFQAGSAQKALRLSACENYASGLVQLTYERS